MPAAAKAHRCAHVLQQFVDDVKGSLLGAATEHGGGNLSQTSLIRLLAGGAARQIGADHDGGAAKILIDPNPQAIGQGVCDEIVRTRKVWDHGVPPSGAYQPTTRFLAVK